MAPGGTPRPLLVSEPAIRSPSSVMVPLDCSRFCRRNNSVLSALSLWGVTATGPTWDAISAPLMWSRTGQGGYRRGARPHAGRRHQGLGSGRSPARVRTGPRCGAPRRVISRVGVPQYREGPIGWSLFGKNATLTSGPAPVRAYIEHLLPAVLDGTVQPGRVFDRTIGIEEVPAGYEAMDKREALR